MYSHSHFHASVFIALETDALEMYSKYLALNATKPVGVTDDIRQKVEGDIVVYNNTVHFLGPKIIVFGEASTLYAQLYSYNTEWV